MLKTLCQLRRKWGDGRY